MFLYNLPNSAKSHLIQKGGNRNSGVLDFELFSGGMPPPHPFHSRTNDFGVRLTFQKVRDSPVPNIDLLSMAMLRNEKCLIREWEAFHYNWVGLLSLRFSPAFSYKVK